MQEKSKITPPNPFPGLRPFTIDESHLFFGREGQSETIVSYLSKYKFAAVTGASGSGKSSLIYCGVIPLLYGGFIAKAGSNWKIIAARPGSSPIWNLAAAFAEVDINNNAKDSADIQDFYYSLLNRHSLGLVDAIKQAFPKDKGNLLIVIDQFEELFRYKENRESLSEHRDDPRAFIKLLVNIIEQEELPVYVVLTMRSDFIGDCSDYQDLTALINKSNYLVPQMTREDYEHVIVGPLKVAGADIEPRLLQEILNSIENNHDQLPVLQHVLMRTWDFWAKNNSITTPLALRDYLAAGKLDNALSLHANEAYRLLSEHEKDVCKILFRSLTERGKEGKGIRRPASVQDISEIVQVQPEEIMRIVDVFREPGRSFLTPSIGTKLTTTTVIDISHESLMRVWDKLRSWVDEEASSSQMYLRLVELAGLYQSGRSGLMRSPDLQVAINWRKSQNPNRAWARRYNPAFEKAMVFLNASEKKFLQEEENKVRIQNRELHRTRRIAVILGVVSVAFFGLMFYAYRQSQEAIAQKERAESYANLVEGEKNEVVEKSQQQEYQLLRERERLDSLTRVRQTQLFQSPEDEKAYQDLVEEVSRRTSELEQSTKLVEDEKQKAELYAQSVKEERSKAELSTKAELRKRMLVLSSSVAIKSTQVTDKQLAGLLSYQSYILNRENGGQINHPEIYRALYNALRELKGQRYNTLQGHTSPIKSIVFDAARNLLYSADTDGSVYRWGFRRANPKPTMILNNEYGNSSLDITSDGRWMACGSESGKLRLINIQLPNQTPRTIDAHTGRIIDVRFVPGKNSVITSGADKTIKLWDLLTNEGEVIFRDNSDFTDIDVAKSGKSIVCVTSNGKLLRWDLNTQTKSLIYNHTTSLHAVAYDYEGEKIAIGDKDGKVLIINALTGKVIKSIYAHASRVLDLEFSPDNRLLASSSLDGIIRIWNVDDLNDLPIEIREHESWVESIAFSPDGKNLLSSSNDGNAIYIWPVKAEDLADEICNYINRQLTQLEWDMYIGKDIAYRKVCE
jgi:energy-coupling factor transporter ATP-binding protein EcfA2